MIREIKTYKLSCEHCDQELLLSGHLPEHEMIPLGWGTMTYNKSSDIPGMTFFCTRHYCPECIQAQAPQIHIAGLRSDTKEFTLTQVDLVTVTTAGLIKSTL